MPLTERQKKILKALVQEYISHAQPVSSGFLQKKYRLDICPATVRNELQKLTEQNYVFQPHTSAGRIPTNKAYRFFVNEIFNESFSNKRYFDFNALLEKEEDIFKFVEQMAKILSSVSSSLTLAYLAEHDFLVKDGWKDIIQNPEFKEIYFLKKFIKTVEDIEKKIKDLFEKKLNDIQLNDIRVYIGREKSVLNSTEFSLIISKANFLDREKGILALLGPNRMRYNKNINLIYSLLKTLEKT